MRFIVRMVINLHEFLQGDKPIGCWRSIRNTQEFKISLKNNIPQGLVFTDIVEGRT